MSIYFLWGWITIEDLRKYCSSKGMDFEATLSGLVPSHSIEELRSDGKSVTIKNYRSGSTEPIYRYLIPFDIMRFEPGGPTFITGAVLEPFLAISENTRNTVFCFGVGYLVGSLLIGLEFIRRKSPTISRVFLRPLLGGASSTLLFIVILSGGALLWNEVNGIKGLSVGLISVIGSLYCEKFAGLVSHSV